MIRRLLFPVAFAILALAQGASAHHNMTALFDFNDRVTLKGTLTKVDWRNPHAHLFVNVPGENGAVANWAIELESPILLRRSGWAEDTLVPGDAVNVAGIAARDGTRQLWAESLVQSDGPTCALYKRSRAADAERPTTRAALARPHAEAR